jgi:oligopeptide/dipeptide ABC transporter ATP-binding protein
MELAMTILTSPPLLELNGLSVRLPGKRKGESTLVVDNLSYTLHPGKTLAILGESGSGKTVSCRSLIGILPENAEVTGSARFMGKELLGLSRKEMRVHRGVDISMVFQDPGRALNPIMRIGEQIAEVLLTHTSMAHDMARLQAIELLGVLRISSPERHYHYYPHQLSGGMQQRVMLAIAIACKPKLLIADEATRALDVTTQAQIVELLKELQSRLNMALIFVSHDLSLAARIASDVLVLQAGRAVEYGAATKVLTAPKAPYTQALVHAGNQRNYFTNAPPLNERPLLVVKDLSHTFLVKNPFRGTSDKVHALSSVSFEIRSGETFGLVGETGSGKSTFARLLLQMPKPASGSVLFQGDDLSHLNNQALHAKRQYMQMVFQDCFASVDPTWNVFSIIAEPLRGLKHFKEQELEHKISQVLELVGLPASVYASRKPRELSGGQCQRVAVARALVTDPKLVILDEALSSLDMLIQQQLLDLLHDIREELKISYIFISHDLAQVRSFCHRVAVMHAGQVCEIAAPEKLFSNSSHPYTRILTSSIPGSEAWDKAEHRLGSFGKGEPPSLVHPPSGCRFHLRCPNARAICSVEPPALTAVGEDHMLACHFPCRTQESMDSTPSIESTSETHELQRNHYP